VSANHEVCVTKLDEDGQPVFSYSGSIVYADANRVVARCLWPSPRTHDLGKVKLVPGDVFMEHYPIDAWYNVFAIYDCRGLLKCWYCNVTEPVELVDGEIRWRDLALDLLIMPQGGEHLLDEEEFLALELPCDKQRRARTAIERLRRLHQAGEGPFWVSRLSP